MKNKFFNIEIDGEKIELELTLKKEKAERFDIDEDKFINIENEVEIYYVEDGCSIYAGIIEGEFKCYDLSWNDIDRYYSYSNLFKDAYFAFLGQS